MKHPIFCTKHTSLDYIYTDIGNFFPTFLWVIIQKTGIIFIKISHKAYSILQFCSTLRYCMSHFHTFKMPYMKGLNYRLFSDYWLVNLWLVKTKYFKNLHLGLNIPQHISLNYECTEMEHDRSPPEERPNVKQMLIRCIFTQGSNSKSLPLKYTNNRIIQHDSDRTDYNQTCII